MIAARLLVEEGVDPDEAIHRVGSSTGGYRDPGAGGLGSQGRAFADCKPESATIRSTRIRGRLEGTRQESADAMSARKAVKSKPVVEPGSKLDRALGAFLGLAVGDALGTTIEFSRRDTYPPVVDMVGGGPFGLKPGEWTDDTSMALCLADSLIAKGGIWTLSTSRTASCAGIGKARTASPAHASTSA